MNGFPKPLPPPQPPSVHEFGTSASLERADRAWTCGFTFLTLVFGAIFVLFVVHALIVTP